MSKPKAPNRKDVELVASAKAFAKAFSDSAAAQTSQTLFQPRSGISFGASGVVEITEEVAKAMAALRSRAMKILGSKAGHEQAINQTLYKAAHQSVVDGMNVDSMASTLIEAVFKQGLVTYEYVTPNRERVAESGPRPSDNRSVSFALVDGPKAA